MSISIKNFVGANIEVLSQPVTFTGFRTTVYFASVTVNTPEIGGGNFAIVNSVEDFDNKIQATSAAIRQSVVEYFKNGGTSLCIVAPSVFSLDSFKADMRAVTRVVDNYFFVVFSDSVTAKSGAYSSAEIFNIANFCSGNGWSETDNKSLNTMRACFTANTTDFVTTNSLNTTLSVVKYSTLVSSGDLIDAALLVGAYFSQVDTSTENAIQDYNFTPESLGQNHFEDIDQTTFALLTQDADNGYYNLIGNVANRILNIGGDYCSPDKISISLDFGAACIERDLDYANIELLFGKLPLTQEGQSKLIDAIRSQLVKYIDNGFLETDATYTGETKKISYNGKQYTIIQNGDILPLGYKVFFVPINAISAADRSAKRFPYIYVALQSVHGARVIQVNGSIL